jgi:hypothetical protein
VYYIGIFLGRLGEITKYFSYSSPSAGQDLNGAPPEEKNVIWFVHSKMYCQTTEMRKHGLKIEEEYGIII